MMFQMRAPAVAGMFYPGAAHALDRDVRRLLEQATALASGPGPKALIVPHAGYVYSGPIAASAYAALVHAQHIRRVILLGPAHRVALHGMALSGAEMFSTPLGTVRVDQAGEAAIAHLPGVIVSPAAHAQEHSLEVQLPFLQVLLSDFVVLPVVVGQASADAVARVLECVWGGQETLIVVSSDLSHYLPYGSAQEKDRATLHDILQWHPLASHEQACGRTPINGLLLAAQRRGLVPHLLDHRNSGDTAGDRSRVVGYAAIAFAEDAPRAG